MNKINKQSSLCTILNFGDWETRDITKDVNDLQRTPVYNVTRKLKIHYELNTGRAFDPIEFTTPERYAFLECRGVCLMGLDLYIC